MIQFSLKCADGHLFDSWFQSSSAYDKLHAAGMVACAVCGSTRVEKAVMAPRVRPSDREAPAPAATPLAQPASPQEEALAKLKAHVETNSDYVGDKFADEARAIHDGTRPERAIYGEAKPKEARALVEDGIPVVPLPFRSNRKNH